jgi:phage terminase large subunit-like protein
LNAGEPLPLGGKVTAGLDLSSRTDLTALVITRKSADGFLDVWPFFWAPEQGIYDRSKTDRVPYDIWASEGFLRTTPGATVDYAFVAKEIADLLEQVEFDFIAYDRWRIDLLKKEFDAIGVQVPLEPFGQGYKDMAPALDAMESDLLNGRIRHGNHPVLNMCAANAIATRDPSGGRKLDKSKTTGRIDGLVALAMSYGTTSHETPDENPYEKRGLRTLG